MAHQSTSQSTRTSSHKDENRQSQLDNRDFSGAVPLTDIMRSHPLSFGLGADPRTRPSPLNLCSTSHLLDLSNILDEALDVLSSIDMGLDNDVTQ